MLRQIEAASRFAPHEYLPVCFGEERIGWALPPFAGALAAHPGVFVCTPDAVHIVEPAGLDAAVAALAGAGWIRGWRNERYEVVSPARGARLFTLERAAFRPFGLQARAAHLNAWVRAGDAALLWIARRSATKPIDPGMLDNCVAGGVPAGSTPAATLRRECGEEAAIPPDLAGRAAPAGAYRVQRGVAEGVNHEVLHVFDLELPAGFAPANRDGEVASFALLTPAEVSARIAAGEFTLDAALVTADFLWRRGHAADARLGAALAALRERAAG